MSRRCAITGKTRMIGNWVSHANNKSKREFAPNVQDTSVTSDVLGSVRLRITMHGLRTIEHNGGLDAYLLGTPNSRLTPEALSLKKRLVKARTKREATAAAS